MSNKELLYKKLNALRLEVDSSIVDDIIATADAVFVSQHEGKPLVSGSLPTVRCTTCGCTLVNNECERCDKTWNDLGNTLYEMGNEEPEW